MILEYSGLYWTIIDYTGLYLTIFVCTVNAGLYWAILGFYGQKKNILDYIGLTKLY